MQATSIHAALTRGWMSQTYPKIIFQRNSGRQKGIVLCGAQADGNDQRLEPPLPARRVPQTSKLRVSRGPPSLLLQVRTSSPCFEIGSAGLNEAVVRQQYW